MSLASLSAAVHKRLPGAVAFLRQKTTIIGVAGVAGAVAGVLDGTVTIAQAIPAVTFSLVAIAMPEHPDAATTASKIAADAVLLADKRTRAQGIEAAAADVVTLTTTTTVTAPA